MRNNKSAMLLLFYIIITGCPPTTSQPVENTAPELRILYRGAQCGDIQTSGRAVWIDNLDQLETHYSRVTQNAAIKSKPGYPAVDFSQEGVLLVSMGQKATGGYALDLTSSKLKVSGSTAEVRFSWLEPSQDAILPQVMTNPCIMLAIPNGPYTRIQLLDQAGRLRLQLNLR